MRNPSGAFVIEVLHQGFSPPFVGILTYSSEMMASISELVFYTKYVTDFTNPCQALVRKVLFWGRVWGYDTVLGSLEFCNRE